MPFSWQIVLYVLKAALRDRIIVALALFFILIVNLAMFTGSAAVIESRDFAVVFAAAGSRLAGLAGLILFVCFFIRRSFESGDMELMLTRPISRGALILSYGLAFFILAALTAFTEGLAIYSLLPSRFDEAHLLWALSIGVENIIMVMASFFFAMVLSSAPLCVLASFAFYVLGRMMGQFLGIAQSGEAFFAQTILEYSMKAVSLVVPRFDLLGQTGWLVYGVEQQGPGFSFVLLQGALFILLLFFAVFIDLRRRQF
ncbi:MAG: hypothetical protein ACT4OY_04085 [Alphaproteobacteria bacterium]